MCSFCLKLSRIHFNKVDFELFNIFEICAYVNISHIFFNAFFALENIRIIVKAGPISIWIIFSREKINIQKLIKNTLCTH